MSPLTGLAKWGFPGVDHEGRQDIAVKKPDGDIRICIDPQPLNTALKREHYKLLVLDDILPDLGHAKKFSKLDVKEA